MKNARLVRASLPALLVATAQTWAPPAAPAADAPAAAVAPVAGLAPYERPAGAPVLAEFRQTPQWRSQALKGVSEPLPASLRFLDSQGAWYTPFNHPGMPGRYDLRGMHRQPAP